MEHHQEQRLQIASTQQNKPSLTSNEILIRQCAQQGQRIGAIDARSIGKTFGELVKKITVITGLRIDPAAKDMFVEQFTTFICTHYSNMTVEEVVTAFHLNANESGEDKVILYGNTFTLELIGQVLTKYKAKRAAVVRKLNSNIAIAIEAPKPTPEQMEIDARTLVNGFYEKYLNQELGEVQMSYAHLVYDDIKKYGADLLPPKGGGIWSKFHKEALAHRQEELMNPIKHTAERHEHRELIKEYLTGHIRYSEEEKVLNEAKRRVLIYMFERFAAKGFKTVL